MNKQESKYFDTAHFFDEALISLLNEKDIDYISVKEVCSVAGFNRSTFYLHYESIYDLLNETLEYINNRFLDYFDGKNEDFFLSLNSCSKDDLMFIKKEYLKPYLSFIRENKNVFLASFTHPETLDSNKKFESLKKYLFTPILEKYEVSDAMKKYMIDFYVHGIAAIIKNWVLNNCVDSDEDILNVIIGCVRP